MTIRSPPPRSSPTRLSSSQALKGEEKKDAPRHAARSFIHYAGSKVSFAPYFFVTILNFTEATRGKVDKFFRQSF